MPPFASAFCSLLALFAFWVSISDAAGEAPGRFLPQGNSTLLSDNGTFELGFFSTNGDPSWFLGIRYASIPIPTYVWVANPGNPIKNLPLAALRIDENGKMSVTESENAGVVWQSDNLEPASKMRLLESGNLVLLSEEEKIVWQSFDFPRDTWLPGMNLTRDRSLVSWRSASDPSPGFYTLRLNPRGYGEFELVYNASEAFWSTRNWTGDAFSNVPEMTIPYIYRFYFLDPFKPSATFGYSEASLDGALKPPLTRFQLEPNGQLTQYTWSAQTDNWNTFWKEPKNQCRVYGLCGNLGLCSNGDLRPCGCLSGFMPVDETGWISGDFSNGCRRKSQSSCEENDVFEELGVMGFEGGIVESFSGSKSSCEKSCLRNCSCVALSHNEKTNLCKNMHGTLLNIKNVSTDSLVEDVLFVRVQRRGMVKKSISESMVLVASIVGSIAALGLSLLMIMIWRSRRQRERRKQDDTAEAFPVLLNLRVFTYKELQTATNGFSEKLGHGGFGAVFRGNLPDSTPVAVKRLERLGGAEKEFRAEVRTIGSIQHVNLVRLRGFCSDNAHRLLVYDYMPNGPLSAYLRRDGPNLSWEVRFRIAIGTARGIAYLHEECRDCIIHCDIKPENILIDGDFMAKVSDFGLAKLIGRDFSRVLATMRGTWGYVAPEWISGVGITTKADVYSFGMTLLELIGGRRNVEEPPPGDRGGGEGDKWFFPPWAARKIVEGDIAAVVDERLGGAYNREEAERVALVAVWCIQDEEGLRPTMGLALKMLEGVVEILIPPPPKLIQALVSGESFQGIRGDSGFRTGSPSNGRTESPIVSDTSNHNLSSPENGSQSKQNFQN